MAAILTRARGVLVWVALAGAVACHRAEPAIDVDIVRLNAEIDRQLDTVLARPEVDQAFSRLITRVGADAEVAKASEGLVAAIGADPTSAQVFQQIISRLGELPVTLQLVKEIQEQNPHFSADEVGALVGSRVEAAIEPVMNQVMDELFAQPELHNVFSQLGRNIATTPKFALLLGDIIARGGGEAGWARRLRALNGGANPDRRRATELLVEHAFNADRLAKFYIDVLAQPSLVALSTSAARQLLAAPAFQRHTVHMVSTLVTDPGFADAAVEVMGLLLEEARNAIHGKAVAARVRALLLRPETTRAFAAYVAAVTTDPELATIGRQWLDAVMGIPELRASFEKVLSDW